MSRKKSNVGYWLTLISVILTIAALLGSFSNLGGVVDKIKDKISGTDTVDDSSTDKGTESTGTGSSNTNSSDSDVRNVYYYGATGFKVMTESASSTEGYILFGFENGYDADTKWYCSWSIDEAILTNTSCSFIPYDYGSGLTLYDIDECYDYKFEASNNTYETVISGNVGTAHFINTTHQFTGVENGDTYVLRMFKYTLTDGKTVADVLNEINPYIEFITFCTYANVQLENPNYGNFSGTLLPPETDSSESDTDSGDTGGSSSGEEDVSSLTLYSVCITDNLSVNDMTVTYTTVQNGEKIEITEGIYTEVFIDVVALTDIYINTSCYSDLEGFGATFMDGVNYVTITSTYQTFKVMKDDAAMSFDVAEYCSFTITNTLGSGFDVKYFVMENGMIVSKIHNETSNAVTLNVLKNQYVEINYESTVEQDTSGKSIGLINVGKCTVLDSQEGGWSLVGAIYDPVACCTIDYLENDTGDPLS